PYALSRGWDYSNVSFVVTNAGGDVQNFGSWKTYYWDGTGYCGNTKGFRLNTWTFPQGPSVSLTYAPVDGANQIGDTSDRIATITTSLGGTLRFNYDTQKNLTSIDDGTARAVAITASIGASPAPSHTDPIGNVTSYSYLSEILSATATQRP